MVCLAIARKDDEMNAKRYLNAAGVKAIESAIGNHRDNLYRYEMAEGAKPGQVTGNGMPFADVIRHIKSAILDLEANFEENGHE